MTSLDFDTVYPTQKLHDAKKHLRNFWNGGIKTVYSAYSNKYEYRQLENMDDMVENAILNLSAGKDLPGYNIPRLAIDFGTISTAAFWGGKIYKPEGGMIWIDPVIYTAEEVTTLNAKKPDTGDVEKSCEVWRRINERTGNGNLCCTMLDLQGPLNTLSLLWEQQNFMMAMYDYPEKVHYALDMVTEHLISLIKSMLEMIPAIEAPLWPYIWLPRDIGIGITEDYMPLLSPQLYKEFGLPYVKRIADAFKGVFIHCCGQFSQHIDNLAASGINILGLEFVYPNIDIEKLFGVFGSSIVFVPNIMDNHVSDFGNMTGYFQNVNEKRNKETRLWFLLRPDLDDFRDQVEFMESIVNEV